MYDLTLHTSYHDKDREGEAI